MLERIVKAMHDMPNYQVTITSWKESAEVLSRIRSEVFIVEQGISDLDEWDWLDDDALHFLLYKDEDIIGCARLLPKGQITRMAVLKPYRKKGAGQFLLQFILNYMKQTNCPNPFIHAQIQVKPFYEAMGFVSEGPTFSEADIDHQLMRYHEETQQKTAVEFVKVDAILGETDEKIAVRHADEYQHYALKMAQQTQRIIRIFSIRLDSQIYNSPAFSDALSELARKNKNTRVELLVVDPKPIVQQNHALLALSRRLPSLVQLRKVDRKPEEFDEEFLLADYSGVLIKPLDEQREGAIFFNNRLKNKTLQHEFALLWQNSIDDPELRNLSLG